MTANEAPLRMPWPPIVFVSAGAAAVILRWIAPLPWLSGPFAEFLVALGVLVMGVGAVLIALAIRRMHHHRTAIPPTREATKLVTDGPFAVSRNPIYLGMVLLLAGLTPIVGSLWFLAAGIVCGAILSFLAIRPEERYLERRFGKPYRDYAKRVRRWF